MNLLFTSHLLGAKNCCRQPMRDSSACIDQGDQKESTTVLVCTCK